MPSQYSSQLRVRVLAVLDEGHNVAELATQLRIAQATPYRWCYQARIDAGKLPGTTCADAVELADAKRRIRSFEEELHATKLAASMLKNQGIRPKGDSRTR